MCVRIGSSGPEHTLQGEECWDGDGPAADARVSTMMMMLMIVDSRD